MEGTYTTLPKLLQSELLESEQAPSKEDDEVLGYVRASEAGFARVKTHPLSLNLIKDLHAILLKNDPDTPSAEKGEFRRKQVFIGPVDSRVEDCHFVPPPHSAVLESLHGWERWIHNENLPLLIRAAVGHYQFETIHPFVNGNGRIGRLIVLLMLLEAGDLSEPLLSISPYLEARRDDYHQRLRELSSTGDFDTWVEFFLQAIKTSAEGGLDKIERLLAWREEMVSRLRSKRIRGLAIEATEDLIGDPILTPSLMAARYKVTYQAAAYTIARMMKEGILEEFPLRGRRKAYASFPILEILES